MALRATWQRHAGPRDAYAAQCDGGIIHIYRKYMVYRTYKSFDYRKIISIPLISSHIINPPPYFNLIRVGLSSTEFLNVQVMWLKARRWITIEARRSSAPVVHRIPITHVAI